MSNWRHLKKLVPAGELRTFLLFVLLAWVIWVMYTRGTQREFELTAPVLYYGVPDDVRMEKEMPKQVTFTISDGGSQTWRYLFIDVDTIEIDLSKQFAESKRPLIRIYFSEYIEEIMSTISQTCKITSIEPTDYESRYEKVFTRRVPVRLSNEPEIDPEYALSSPLTIEPSEVRIRGSRRLVEHVQYVRVDTLRGKLRHSETRTIPLVGIKGVDILEGRVKVTATVERMTEKSFTLPVIVRNEPEGYNVRVFPKKVNVVFNVGLSRYKSLSSTGMSVIFDCNTLTPGDPKHRLVLESKDTLNDIIYKIVPEEVEYIKEAL